MVCLGGGGGFEEGCCVGVVLGGRGRGEGGYGVGLDWGGRAEAVAEGALGVGVRIGGHGGRRSGASGSGLIIVAEEEVVLWGGGIRGPVSVFLIELVEAVGDAFEEGPLGEEC